VPVCEPPRLTESKFRVLYLGDDLQFIARFRETVDESVYRLVGCADGGSAELFLKSDIPYDLLLIDHDWRGTEALKLARLSRSQRHRKRMPIVIVSGSEVDGETKTLAEKAGIAECVLKSADMNELMSRVINDE
jgi:DNA-binding response OmpR family regulator